MEKGKLKTTKHEVGIKGTTNGAEGKLSIRWKKH
jgi:hypothetical protein